MSCYVYNHTVLNEADTNVLIHSKFFAHHEIKFSKSEPIEHSFEEGEDIFKFATHVIQGEAVNNEMYGKCEATLKGKKIEIHTVNRINPSWTSFVNGKQGEPTFEEFFTKLIKSKPTSTLII